MFKLNSLIFLLFIVTGCKSQEKNNYLVSEIYNDKCIESYYRLILKDIDNDSIYQVLSLKNEYRKINIKKGDTIKVRITKINNKNLNINGFNSRLDGFDFYCDDKLILKSTDYFYKSIDIDSILCNSPPHSPRLQRGLKGTSI